MIEKRIPGKGWEYIIYDKLGRPALTQDAIQRTQNKWLFTKYDVLGRVAYTGIYTHSSALNQKQMQNYFDAAPTNSQPAPLTYENKLSSEFGSSYVSHYYTTVMFPFNNIEILTVNYYDDYTFNRAGANTSITSYGVNSLAKPYGLLTGSKVKVLGTNNWITTVTYYDDKARPIYVYSKNDYLQTTDIVESKLDFTGKAVETKSTHKKTGKSDIVVVDKYTYDHAARLLTQKQTINGSAEELIVKNHYDDLGQLIKKDVGDREATPLQQIDYSYNVRGWLKKINDPFIGLGSDLFSMELHYNDSYGTKLYNGNISMTHSKTANDNANRRYMYNYDDLNRITSASYYTFGESSRYSLGSVSYDKNGNILNLQRNGAIVSNPDKSRSGDFGNMDNLSYTYDGNQLLKVGDTGNKSYGFKDGANIDNDYTYDANGNMITDKNITNITYNHMNLPTRVSVTNGVSVYHLDYVYDATGVKQAKINRKFSHTPTTEYAGNFIYEKVSSRGGGSTTLQFFNTSEGYATPNSSGGFDYIYQYKDHIGNVRLSYTENPNAQTTQTVFSNSFENMADWDKTENTFGWALSALDSSKKKTGAYSGRIDDNYPTHWGTYVNCDIWTPINNVTDTYYTFSAWVFVEDIPNNDARVFLMTRRAGETGYPTGTYDVHTTKRGEWEYIERSVKVPADVRELNFRIDNNKEGTVWFDDVKIVKGNTARTLIVEESNYYPFGLRHRGYNNVVSPNGNSIAQKWKFQGQELEEELGKNTYAYQWRDYDPAIGRFNKIDRFAEKYYQESPYHFTKNNPLIFTEIKGDSIAAGSQAEWNKQKQAVVAKRDNLQSKIDGFNEKAVKKGWSAAKLKRKIGNLSERVAGLNENLKTLGKLESSSQVYSLNSGASINDTSYDPSSGNIVISYKGTALFVHETTHAGQFESGDLAFDRNTGNPYGQDIFDEIAGYKAQYSYNPSTVGGISSASSITASWVQGITKPNGDQPYKLGGSSNTGIAPVNINSNRADLIRAYPHARNALSTLPANKPLKSLIPTIYYKK